MAKIIKTAIVERRDEWREKLVSLINVTPGFSCAGDYAAIKDALREFDARLPDIVLCNFHFADASEKKFVRALHTKYPGLPILVLNLYDEGECVFDAPQDEPSGYVLKITLPAKLVKNELTTHRPDTLIFDNITANAIRLLHNFLPPERIDCELTPHETRLLNLLVDGHNYTTAAKVLRISYNTVKFHMRRIYQKLEVNSKSAAVAKALRHRLLN
jgi:DNA-binding NarL/FixJ family response regulator